MNDNKFYKLNIDSGILELLGPSLYTNIYYVLGELIANAYDANAKNVYIIRNSDSIVVEDDGSGMSYDDGDINKYLNVAKETRTNADESIVPGSEGKRKKMGRKGIGKLAALSVSEDVEIRTIKNGERSGFILSRKVNDNNELTPISEEDVNFKHISDNGTSITMRSPQYDMHKTLKSVKNNIARIFPYINEDFMVHVDIGNKKIETIGRFEDEAIPSLACLITIGEEFHELQNKFSFDFKEGSNVNKDALLKRKSSYFQNLMLTTKSGKKEEFQLKINGWLGAYRSTRGRKKNQLDFQDNFLSLISNGKVGEFNILPIVGKNALNEVYVVGQLHVDLFEETLLPDMALSNRQGYKTDDIRYQTVISHVKKEWLPEIVNMRLKYSEYNRSQTENKKKDHNSKLEKELVQKIENFKNEAADRAAAELSKLGGESTDGIRDTIHRAINRSLPSMGIKSKIDANKKKLLISHSSEDKLIGDFVYRLITYAGVPGADIIYTSNDDSISRIPDQKEIFEYLREFFIDSYSNEKIFVLYLTSEKMSNSWACLSEVGAGWVLKSDHNIFNLNNFTPKNPLNKKLEWACIEHDENSIKLSNRDIDVLAEKVIYICEFLGYSSKEKDKLKAEIKLHVEIKDT